jgi:hypothetical protein
VDGVEGFVAGDPFVLNDLVACWHVTAWIDVLLEPI